MIPRTIHYCWFAPQGRGPQHGHGTMPQQAQECLASWHHHMPDWNYRLWDESTFDVQSTPYTAEAYAAGKYAFVSDYVRLWALEREGGIYLDTDVVVLRSFAPLLDHKAFAGFEGSKHLPVGTCVMASEPHGLWITEMLNAYHGLHFLTTDGLPDLTTNVQRLTALMAAGGLRQDGSEQDYLDLHLFPVDYFSPRHTTGEYLPSDNTYSDHLGLGSWSDSTTGWKSLVAKIVGQENMTRLIKLKRQLTHR